MPTHPFCFLSYKPSEQQTGAKERLTQGTVSPTACKCSQGEGVILICKGVAVAAGCACPMGTASPCAWFDGSIWLPQLCVWGGGKYGHFREVFRGEWQREGKGLDIFPVDISFSWESHTGPLSISFKNLSAHPSFDPARCELQGPFFQSLLYLLCITSGWAICSVIMINVNHN